MQTVKKVLLGSVLLIAIASSYVLSTSQPHNKLQELQKQRQSIKDVVFIVVDTLRADNLPWHGGESSTAPFLASLAEKSVVFDRAYSGCSSTAPALASIFTGRYPSRHGVITGLLAHRRLASKSHDLKLNRIPKRIQTLPEFFQEAGFTTLGVADNLNISHEMGFAQGFDSLTTTRNVGAAQVNKTVLEWQSPAQKNRFFYIHYMDPHAPYERKEAWILKNNQPKNSHIEAYKSEIRHVDEHIKALFARKIWGDDALIVFVADHGEAFSEHEASGHGKNLHTEVVRVPFFMYHPKLRAHRVRRTVHTADILPTLVDIFGWIADENWQGQSLLNKQAYGRPIYSELLRPQEHPRTSEESVIADSYQLIVAGEDNRQLRLYDIYNDLQQVNNLINDESDKARELLALLNEHRKSSPQDSEETVITMDADGLEHLKTLGYLQ